MRFSILVVLCAARIAAADPGTPPPPPDHKDESTAVLLSLSSGVLLPIVLVGAARETNATGPLVLATTGAIIFGPAAGHWYAGESGGIGIVVRTVGVSAALIGFVTAANADCETQSCTDDSDRAAKIAVAGAALVVGSAIWDVATAGRAARRYNESQLTVAPVPLSTGGAPTLGLGIGGTF